MDSYLQTGLSICVSVVLFLLGYRQTIGAHRERIKSANEKLLETILKRVILEKYRPKRDDIQRLAEGKARDFKVKSKDLLNVDQILNSIYTRIFENDLISQEQRDQNIERLSSLFADEKKELKQEIDKINERPLDRSKKVFNVMTISLGIISIIVGVSLTSFDKLLKSNFDFSSISPTTIIALAGSILAIIIAYAFLKFKDSQENVVEQNHADPYKDSVAFENEVIRVLKKMNVNTIIPNGKDNGIDLIAEINAKKVAIQIKYLQMRPPISYMQQLVAGLTKGMSELKIEQGFIVTTKTFKLNESLKKDQNIQIVDLDDLKRFIKEK